jgi:hypothetical protein
MVVLIDVVVVKVDVHDRDATDDSSVGDWVLPVCLSYSSQSQQRDYEREYSIYHYAYAVCTRMQKHVHKDNLALA